MNKKNKMKERRAYCGPERTIIDDWLKSGKLATAEELKSLLLCLSKAREDRYTRPKRSVKQELLRRRKELGLPRPRKSLQPNDISGIAVKLAANITKCVEDAMREASQRMGAQLKRSQERITFLEKRLKEVQEQNNKG